MSQPVSQWTLRKQAWDFFQMQTSQRLTTFNFYIVISSLITTGLTATLKGNQNPIVVFGLGLALILLSGTFWKLDQRNRDLIHSAEDALKFFEGISQLPDNEGVPHVAKRFLREEYDTQRKVARRTWRLWRNHYKYSECFGAVFCSFSVVGFIGVGAALVKWLTPWCT
jgi:hypothetical protein